MRKEGGKEVEEEEKEDLRGLLLNLREKDS